VLLGSKNVHLRGIAVGSQGFYDYVKGLFASFWPLKKKRECSSSADNLYLP